jgi:L-threonylcarbamoyladenylate synthase
MASTAGPRRVEWPDNDPARAALLGEAVDYLRAGQVVALPTDTVYGLAVLPGIEAALKRLYQLKARPPEKAIALLVSGTDDLARFAREIPASAYRLAERFWPGGLTLVLRSAVDPSTTVALRMPCHPVPLLLIAEAGSPLATTSANRSSLASPRSADDVLAQLPSGYPLLIDGGPSEGGIDSTVLDLTRSPAVVLRQGAIAPESIAQEIGTLAQS